MKFVLEIEAATHEDIGQALVDAGRYLDDFGAELGNYQTLCDDDGNVIGNWRIDGEENEG